MTQQNNTIITVTNKQVYGVTLRGKFRFVVPYNSLVCSKRTCFALFRVLYLQYRADGCVKEVSIMGNFVNYENIQRAYELVHN